MKSIRLWMLHLFVYEIPEKKDYKLLLSNLSRLIPSDFYGNRVSTKPECLFKSWKKQYQKYNQNSNDALKKYHTSLEYKYEVTLDLENFFPTINPIIIYHYIVKNLPAHLKKEDMNLMKRLLRKLLFCKLVTQLDEKMLKQYYKAFKSQTNNKETVKKSKDINVCGNIKQCEFARGIAQGLPQSYFLGNIYMIIVSRIFRNEFSGASYFYVDDSVIFTNDVIETEFKEQLKEINKQIEAKEREILQKHSEENLKIYPCKTKEFYESYLYGVHVHLEEKSAYTRLDSLDEGEVYLKSISRQMSQAGSDFFKMHSDEENKNLEKKFAVLSEQVKIKSEQLEKANLTKNVQGNDIDILSVKKYMLDSYRKIDNYFEEAVRSKHANDSAAEIRKRSELNYLDTSMRELVAEVSEAHGADERDIYGIKSVASKQLISIKFDKILLRLADLLDMSSYRVSKPILYHNVEQMSEESAFHWISHLLTKGYSLRTEYEITDNAHVLAPKNIIEKLVLEIPVNISQMSALTCGRTCKKVGIDRNRLSQQGIVLVCGQECKDNGNQERNCNFLCKWFCVKNENLIKELAALKEYLNRNKNNYFKSAIEIRIKCNDRTSLDARQFEILNEYIGKM